MEQSKIDQLNALAKKAKTPAGLTQEELTLREVLRRAYLDAWKANLTTQMDNTYIQYPDGTRKKLKKKDS